MKQYERERMRLRSLYGALYRWHQVQGERLNVCFYCGDSAGTADHVPSLTWLDTIPPQHWRTNKVPLTIVRTCGHCNLILGNKALFTVAERLQHLEGALGRRYEKAATLWMESEIAEMSPQFQRTIRARQAQTRVLLARVEHVRWRLIHDDTHPVWIERDEQAAEALRACLDAAHPPAPRKPQGGALVGLEGASA